MVPLLFGLLLLWCYLASIIIRIIIMVLSCFMIPKIEEYLYAKGSQLTSHMHYKDENWLLLDGFNVCTNYVQTSKSYRVASL